MDFRISPITVFIILREREKIVLSLLNFFQRNELEYRRNGNLYEESRNKIQSH